MDRLPGAPPVLINTLDAAVYRLSPGKMSYRWILFDADNTLFDFDRSAREALQQTVEAHGHRFESDQVTSYERINACYWQAFERGEIDQDRLRVERFEELLPAIGMPTAIPGQFAEDYERNLSRGCHLLDGAEQILETLKPHVQLALITNGLKDVQRPRLANSPIRPYFRVILISEEVGAAKPDPRIFEIAFQRMGSPTRAEVLIVGDSLSSDIQGGSDFGIDTCWFNPTRKTRDRDVTVTFEIESLEELAPICLRRSLGLH